MPSTMQRIARACAVAPLFCAAAAGAQGTAFDDWSAFRAADGSFAIVFPAGGPHARVTKKEGAVTEVIYAYKSGTTALEVHEWTPTSGSGQAPVPAFDDFCVSCAGHVLGDTTVVSPPFEGHWVYVEHPAAASGGASRSLHRLLVSGPRRYLVQAVSAAGQPLAKHAAWFVASFSVCHAPSLCLPTGVDATGRAKPLAPPFAAQLPAVTATVVPRAPKKGTP